MANQLLKIYQDLQAQAFDLRALFRLAGWGCTAAAALMVAVVAAYSAARSQGQVVAADTDTGARSPMLAITAELAGRAADMENEARRLSEAVAALTADREQLKTRIASLERGLEDVTGSVKRQTATSQAAAKNQAAATPADAASQLPAIAFAPAPLAGAPPQRAQPASEAVAAPTPAAPQQPTRVATPAPIATPVAAPPNTTPATPPSRTTTPATPPPRTASTPPVAASSVALTPVATTPVTPTPDEGQAKGEFAIDVGGAVNFDGLRVLWHSSRNANAVLFEGLQPLVAVRESKSRGVDLRLIVGPLASTEAATRMCAALLAARRSCQMTTYEGQPLPLAAPPNAERSSERQAERQSERRSTASNRNSSQPRRSSR